MPYSIELDNSAPGKEMPRTDLLARGLGGSQEISIFILDIDSFVNKELEC